MKYLCPYCKSERISAIKTNAKNKGYKLPNTYPINEYSIKDNSLNEIEFVCLLCEKNFYQEKILIVDQPKHPTALDETTINHIYYLLLSDKMKALNYCKDVLGYSLQESIKIIGSFLKK